MKDRLKDNPIVVVIALVIALVGGLFGGKTMIDNGKVEPISDFSQTSIIASYEEQASKSNNQTKPSTSSTEKKTQASEKKEYRFRNQEYLSEHYVKHGVDMGFDSEEAYVKAANAVINNPKALTKTEAEDGDPIYYIEATNEIVFVSGDGYIRTYFICGGKYYYDKQ